MRTSLKTIDRHGCSTIEIGPLTLQRLERDEAIALVSAAVGQRYRLDIAICNAHTVLLALDDPGYADVLKRMTLLNDGVGVNLASRLLSGESFPANLNGTDLIPDILAKVGMPLRIFLLGASPASLEGAAQHLARTYPAHEIVGYRNGFFTDDDLDEVIGTINAARPDLLLVAMGNPLQERFIIRHRERLSPPVCIGVGALFDFMSGNVARAPRVMRALGLEWLFRFMQEPRRLARRYFLGIPRFLLATLRLAREQKATGERTD